MDTRDYLIKPMLNQHYPVAVKGEGIYLYDRDGKKYLDGSSGAVTASIGHGIREIIDAMTEQAEKVSFTYRSQFTNEPAEELAYELSTLCPGNLNWSFFVGSGSEATETAMKIAIQHWQEQGKAEKNHIISRWMSYHGITLGALSMSGHIARRERFEPLLEKNPVLSPPYSYRSWLPKEEGKQVEWYVQEFKTVIQRIGKERIAAFIAEPIVGAAGAALVPPDGYFEAMKRVCEENDILMIADEVMTGFGRTGKMFAMEHWGVVPDIMVFGKGMSAGYSPIAAAVSADHVIAPILSGSGSVMAGHTYSGNPLSAAVSLAVIRYMKKHQLPERADLSGRYLMNALKDLQTNHFIIGDVRGKGLLIGIEFVADRLSKTPFPAHAQMTHLVVETAKQNGLLVYPASAGEDGVGGAAVMIAPPLSITQQEMDELIQLFEQTITQVEQEVINRGFFPSAM
ncbi:adenosylmethionine-8-amino-7-oxononanoate aminotransferase [Bacillus pumilus]|uniref:aspartate aminotransferase family protein n=1 Tax=Bacillus pumilus TaxID=1408 RepID=UPI00277D392D|nr:aspartate aminotransferase family protein [Bacillus pumilus]MDQ0815981.1 adenosylmethionine-8-amino-7-oxononanoate aminotransferase [Bacillus pumilus]